MTNKEAHELYKTSAYDIGCMIGKLAELRDRFEFASQETQDNGDPSMLAESAVTALGELLGAVVVYCKEYGDEIENKVEKAEKK